MANLTQADGDGALLRARAANKSLRTAQSKNLPTDPTQLVIPASMQRKRAAPTTSAQPPDTPGQANAAAPAPNKRTRAK